MTTVVGIDPSLSATGVAVWRDRKIYCTTVRSEEWNDHNGWAVPARHSRVCQLLSPHLTGEQGTVVAVMEQQIKPTAEARRGTSTLDVAALRAVILQLLYLYRIPIAYVYPSTLKVYGTGRGDADKAKMLRAVQALFGPTIPVANDNEADASWLMLMGVDHYGLMPGKVLGSPRALDRVTWPTMRFMEVDRGGVGQGAGTRSGAAG